MSGKKCILLMFLSILVLISLAEFSFAIGMRGVMRTTVVHKPNEHFDFEYEVISNMPDAKDIELYVIAPAELKDSVKLSTYKINKLPSGGTERFTVTIDMPANLSFYGGQDIRIGAVEEMPQLRRSAIGSRSAVEAFIVVFSPYPGKYILGQFDIPRVAVNEPVYLNLILRNYGQENVDSVSAIVDIFDASDAKVATLKSYAPDNKNKFTVPVNKEESREMYVDWTPVSGTRGVYRAVADIIYDGQKTSAEGKIMIGDLLLDITNFTSSVYGGSITELVVSVLSQWNFDIQDVYVEVIIYNATGEIARTKSVRNTVGPWGGRLFNAYLNSEKIDFGKYKANVTAFYEGRTTSKIFDFEVIKRSVAEEKPAVPGVTTPVKEAGTNWVVVLLVVVIVLVFGQIIFFLLFKRRKDKKKKNKKGKARRR